MSLARAVLGNISSTIFGNLILLLTGILTARILGPEGKGLYVMALLVPTLVVNALTLGIGNAGAYYIARRERDVATVIGTSLAIVLPAGLVCTLAFEWLQVLGLWDSPAISLIAVAAWSIPPILGFSMLRHAMLGMQRYGTFNVLNILERGSVLLCLLGGFLARGADVRLFCLLFVIASYASFLVAAVLGWLAAGRRWRVDAGYARQALHYGLRGHVGWLAELLNYRLDMLLVHALAGARELGIYSAAVSLAETLWILSTCISVVLMPRLASARQESTATTAVACRLTLPITLLGAVVLAVTAGPLLRVLYGPLFAPSLQPLWLLLPGVVALSVVKILSADFGARNRPGIVSMVSWISLGATIALDVLLIPGFAASGAAVASSAAYTLSTIVAVAFYRRLTGTPAVDLLVPRRSDTDLLLGSLRRLAGRTAPGNGLAGRDLT